MSTEETSALGGTPPAPGVPDASSQPEASLTLEKELSKLLKKGKGRRRKVARFSPESIVAIGDCNDEFRDDLGLLAIRLAGQDRAQDVSTAHVDEADKLIRGGKGGSVWLQWCAALALGVAIPLFIQYVTTKNPPKSLGGWLMLSLVIGLVTLGAALRIEIKERQGRR
jgi:hypothetical protein